MAIQSMTGFGKGEALNDDYTVSVEVKSVNHRFKDIRFKMSSLFNAIEMELKGQLTDKFARGSFDIYVNYKRAEGKSKFNDIDNAKVEDFLNSFSALCAKHSVALTMSASDLLRSEFMRDQDEGKADVLGDLVKKAFGEALSGLTKAREMV